jgi:hypothetical protein
MSQLLALPDILRRRESLIANAVAFLASAKAQYITSSTLTVDGGTNASGKISVLSSSISLCFEECTIDPPAGRVPVPPLGRDAWSTG